MFGFKGSSEGIEIILEKISKNEETQKLTHKQVRAYARCLLNLVPYIHHLDHQQETEITALFASLSSSGLPHYDRSFLAANALKLLKSSREESAQNESF
ncbi:MAG: hypothetical protein RM021_031700 [Nostoc sp. EkiNYC01]|nr:hypothetical protein [Nostoc sp. EkiNYC01]